jgi:hypothetical protein
VAALVDLVEVDDVRVRMLDPAAGCAPDLAGKRREGERDGRRRFDLFYALGRVPHDQRMATIDLYGREVIHRVRELLGAATHPELAAGARR